MKHHVLASAALFAAAFSGLSLDRAHAAQIKDDDNGSYVDDFSDGVGISTFSGTLVNVSSGVVELLAAQPGHFITKDINPTALSAWNKVYLKGTAGFELTILDSSGTVLQAATLVGSDDPNFSQMAIISGVAASNKPIRLKINIAPNGPIWPALDKVKVTWSPEATLLLSAQSPSTLCSGATGLWKFPFSVSNVTARTVVVKVPLTSGQLSPTFADQTPNLQFIGATQGGQYHAGPGPIVVDGVTIDPQTVYWRLGDVRYGSTFPLSFTAVIPNGTLKNTTWNFTATAAAGNAQTVQAAVPTTTADASPGLVLEKTLTGVYRIGNEWRARNGSTIGYRLTARHSYSPTCRATIENAVIWDPLTITTTPSAQAPYAGAPTLITPGLVYTAGGATPYPANGYTTPITVPANSVYAKIDSLPVGASMTWEFTLPLSGALNNDELVTNKAYANITYTPQRQANNLEATASFKIGIDYAPHGLYAKGDSIRGSASISGGQDNVNLSVGYGEYLKFLLFAGNQGASVLKTTTLFDKLPVDKVDFVDAYAPPGVTLYYYDGGTTNAANDPPGYNATTGALTGWTTSPGATVNWVAAKIDRIGSSVITDLNGSAPLSTTVEIGVRVKPPTNGCSNDSITNDGAFHTVSYENGAGTVIATNMAIATNAESVTVVPQVPSFALSWASSNPAIALTSGPIDYTVNLTNLVPGAPGQTDLATNVSVRIDVPRTSIAGVTRAIDVIGVDTFGGTVDTNGLPDFFIVTYPQLAAGASAAIVVHTSVPRGVVDGGQARLSAVITGEDTGAFTCPVSATTVSATTTFRVDPVLRVDKRVDFEVAGRDKDITYTLRSVNTGDGAALGPVVVDKLPADLVFVDAAIPSNGQRIWFSAADVPVLPPDVRDTYTWSSSFISASGNFVQGQVSNGRIISPIANPKWIAVLVDDATLTPPQLPADGLAREVSFKMHVPATMQLDRVILNEANISAQGLPRAVSNRPQTLISDDPALRITGECVSAIAALENRHFIQTFTNTSTNDDTSVSARLTVPLADVTPVALTVTSPSGTFSVPLTGGQNVTFTTNVDLMTIAWNVTAHLGRPLAAGEAVTMDLEFEAKSTLTTGASVNLSAQGSASNLTGTVEVGAQCQTLVANPDLRIFKLVDRDRVVAGDTVNYTLVIDNIGAHDVTNAVIRELLPSGLTYVAGSARVSPASWSLQNIAPFATGGTDPLNGGQVLEWSLAHGNAIDGPTTPAGTIPASSPRIYLSFRANVTATAAGTEINNCAKTAIGPEANGDQLGDEAPGNNEACVVIRLPYPDPKILKTGPADVLPGASFAYTLTWANGSRQPADNVVFFERVPNLDFGADANPDLTVSSVAAPSGVEVFYASAAYTSNAATDHPAFDFANPTGSGTWKSSIAALGGAPATWIAFKVGALAGLAAPRSATVQVSAIDPDTLQPVAAGATIENCASIEMSGIATQDETPGNNTSCIITRVPGLNIAVQKTCDPSGFYPGARPGDTVRFVIDIKNVGYSASYGVRVTDVLPSWFELAGLESNIATAVESSGAESSFVDALGQPIAGGVTWTRDGDDWRLGTNANGDARYYRKVGMRPDTATQLVVFGRVALDTAAETLASNTVTVATDRRDNLEESETILADNTASCSFTVHRPDPAVEKFVTLPSTANGAASPGDILDYAIGYDNLGLAAASGVELEDLMPVGVTFIVGSVTDVPDGATLEYFDGSDWNYTPSGADGTPDANVKGIRVSFGTFPAPLAGNFNQNSQGSFARGTYDGTHWDADLGAVVATVGSNVTTPTYTSPLIPTDGSQVQEWISFIGHAAPGSTRPEIDLLDVNGDVIGTIQPDVPDSIALGDFVDPTVNELVQLRARFQSPNAGRYDAGFTFLEPAAEGLPQDGEVWLLSGDFAAGLVYPHVAYGGYGEGGGGSPGATSAALWQKVNGTWQLVPIQQPPGVQIGSIDYLSDTLLIGSGTSYPYSVWAWTKAGDGSWTLAELGADNPADDGWEFADTAVITGPNASFCLTSPCELTVLSTYQRAIVAWSTSDGVGSEELDLLGDYFYNFQINDQGYIFAEASTQFAMWIFNGTSWNVSTVARLGGAAYNDPTQSENSADAFVQEYSAGTFRVLRLHFDGEILAKTTLASDAALTGGGRGGSVHGYRTGSGGSPLIWRQGGSPPDNATYTEIELPLPGGATQGRVMDINEAGVAVGYVTDSSSVDHPAVWQPTSPTTYSVSEPNGQVIQGGIEDLGDDNVAFTSYYDGLFGFYPYGSVPADYESYQLTGVGGSYLDPYNSNVRDADADHFVGKVATYDSNIGSITRPGFWALSDLDLGTYQIPATLLDTPGGPVEGGILEQTADGCVLGFANGGDLYQWVNGAPEPLDTGIYYTVSYATSAPGHRHFANASGPNGDVVLELVCSGGTWTTVELSKGNFTDTMVEYFDGETQTLRGRDTLTYNALYWSLGGTAPRVIAYFDDDGTGYGDASPRARGNLVGAMLYDSANGRVMAGVFDPQPTGDDDMTVTVLGGLQPGQSSAYVDSDGSSRILGTIYGPGSSEVSIGIWTLGTSGWQLTNVVPGYEASAFIGDGASAIAVGTQYNTYVAVALESVNGVLTPTSLHGTPAYVPYLDAGINPNLRAGRALGYFTATTDGEGLLFFRTVDGHIETFTAPGAPTDYNGAQAVAMLRPGVFLVYETNPEFSYQDAYIYTFGTGGEMVRTLVDTGEYAAISVYGQYIGEVGDDGSFLAWMSNDPFGYPLPLTAVALVPDGNEPSGYRAVPLSVTGVTDQAPPAIRTSTGCWSLPMQTVQTGENSGLNGIDPTNPNPFRLWGCPLASDGPAESLASWNVIYRSDAKPRIGFQARVDRVCQLEIANTATISTTSAQVSTDNDTSTARVNVATADLAVTVTTPMTVVRQDEPELTVTVGIENRGPMAAKDVVVNLALPAGIALGMGGQTQWTLPSLAANTSTQFQVPVVVTNLDADVTLRLTGNASSASLDCTPDNDSVTLSLLVGTWADIRVTKTGPATVRVFEPFTWQVGWQNLGNDSTQPFAVNDELPLDDNLQVAVELLSIGSADDLDTVLQWPDQVLDVSQANNDEILAVVSDCSMVGKTLVNRAIATYPDDANPSDNEASTSTVVTGPLASLAAIVTGPDSALAGQSTTFSANVESTGSDKARGGVLTITVDNGTIPTSTVGTPMGNTLIVPLYDLAPDALSNVNFEVVSNIAYTITATVSGDNVCPPPVVLKNVGMDTPECTFDFDCAPAMDSCHEARCVDFVCVEVPLTGNFCEDGNACTTGDTCMDGVCQGGSDGLCDDFNACTDDVCDPMMGCSNTTITCDDGFDCTMDSCDIATGCTYMPNDGDCGDGAACTTDRCDPQDIDSDTRGCVSQPDNAGCDDFDNCTMDYCGGPMAGTADGCVHDEIPGCRVTTTNVVITKTPDLQSMQVRGQVTWTLTAQNFGTLTATNVVVSDWLPVGMNYVSAAPVPTTNSGSFYFWNVGDLAPGGTFSVTFTATAGCDVFQGAMGGTTSTTVTNTAYVTADNDPDDLDYVTDGDTDEAQVEVYRILGNDTCNGFDDDCDGIDGNDDTCDDGNDCTDDVCANGACQHNGNANACDDGDNCTTNDLCQNTECQGSTVNCDDGIPCTADYCDPATGMCQHDPMGGFCNDGLDCTMDSCSPFDPRADFNGCVYAADDMACDDGFSCTSDHCQPGVGCVAEPNDMNCGPGNDCTTNSCNPSAPEAGADGCVAAINDMVCNDGIDCTNDSCDPQMGCQHVTDDTACMNGGECRTGTCDATMGCVYTPEPERCDDGNACTTDTCDEATGACMNAEIGCDDNSLCTMDSCDPTFGCRYEPIACDDFNACTSDSCDDTMGCVNETLDCGDDNACTSDSCNPATGCEYEPVTCNDFDACTSDSCNPAEGCTYATITCNGDACNAGSCDPTMGCQLTPIDCDDNNACTNDVCNPIMGCLYTQVSCNDGDACTDDVCDREMGCTTVESSCDDNNPCTTDSCDPVLGCQHAEVTCDDFNACTSDACDPVQGCVNTTLSCDDGDFCTDDSCDVATGCAHEQVPPVEVECGAGACGGVTQGLSQCIDNAWVDNCEEVPTGTIPDTGCSPKRVAYAIVNDENGEPYGTIRCFQDLTTFAVSCETVPGTSELKVYDAFFCGLNDEVTK